MSLQQSNDPRRLQLREALASGQLQRWPGAHSPLVAMLVQEIGFDGVYVSGGALSADMGLPDIGLTTLTEVVDRGGRVAAATRLPVLIDADTGFGEPLNVARTVRALEGAGLSGCHIEDQINPKRCGHLGGKDVVTTAEMVRRIRAAVTARTDDAFVLCARTDARAVAGLDEAIERARAYVAAGADMIFPEALASEQEFERFRAAVDVPLLANMTEFGKSPLLTADQLRDLGMNAVIYPVTSLRLAMGAVESGLRTIHSQGTQASLIAQMQTRARLYDLLRYHDYESFDAGIAGFDQELQENR